MINAANLYNKGIKIKLAGCPIWGTLYLVEKTPLKEPALYVFGNGTTPDILTRYYLGRQRSDYPLNYAFNTAGEITQGILAGKVNRAVLGEPFLSIALRKDSSLRITADLNHLTDSDTLGIRPNSGRIHPDDGEISYSLLRMPYEPPAKKPYDIRKRPFHSWKNMESSPKGP